MSNTSPTGTVLDPDRPWISDAEDLPSRMNWMGTFLNPGGESPKLHFTRAWTVLFFTQLFAWIGPMIAGLIVTLAGGDGTPVSKIGAILTPIVFVLTTLLSFNIHSRRLNHAGKSWLWSIIVLIPLIVGLAMFYMGTQSAQKKYDDVFAEREIYLQDPAAWEEQKLEKNREAVAKRNACRIKKAEAKEAGTTLARDDECNQRGQGQRGRQGNSGPQADQPLPDQFDYVIRGQAGVLTQMIMVLSFFVMIWSLTWVARTPNFGRQPEALDADSFN